MKQLSSNSASVEKSSVFNWTSLSKILFNRSSDEEENTAKMQNFAPKNIESSEHTDLQLKDDETQTQAVMPAEILPFEVDLAKKIKSKKRIQKLFSEKFPEK